jgi:hypothetical protein
MFKMIGDESQAPDYPETFEQALAWAKMRTAETGEMPLIVSNRSKVLTFDLGNSTVTRGVWDEDNNLVEMTYCGVTGNVLRKNVIRPAR